jgi:dUTP pyrophosphatase
MGIFRRIQKLEDEVSKLKIKAVGFKLLGDELEWLYDGVTLKFQNDSPNPDPVYACEGDSGFDLRAWIKPDDELVQFDGDEPYILLMPHERQLIHTGIKCELPHHVEIQVRPRSGNALKLGLSVANTPGTVDELYRAEIGVIALNTSNESIIIKNGDRIAQAVLCPVLNSYYVNFEKVDAIDTNTERGEGGYGHTGTK